MEVGDTLIFTAKPAAGYSLDDQITVGAKNVTLDDGGSHEVVADDFDADGKLKVSATFVKLVPDDIGYITDENTNKVGSYEIKPVEGNFFEQGKKARIMVTPNTLGYGVESITVTGGETAGQKEYKFEALALATPKTKAAAGTARYVDVPLNHPITAVAATIVEPRKVEIPSLTNATATAKADMNFYKLENNVYTSVGTTVSAAGTYYVEHGTKVTFTVKAANNYAITEVLNGMTSLKSYTTAISQDDLQFLIEQNFTLAVKTAPLTNYASAAGEVSAPIAVLDSDGDPLEDNDGRDFPIAKIASDGEIVLDGITPGQTFYIELGNRKWDYATTLDCDDNVSHTVKASELVDKDLFKLSLKKDGDGKSLVSSIEQAEKTFDGVRGYYLKVTLKDSISTEEKKADIDITFKARKTLSKPDDKHEWHSGDEATLNLLMWIENIKKSGSDEDADVGDRIYIDPESNEYNTFIWGDDRAALEYYAEDNADAFYARLSTKSDIDIYTEYGDPVNADLWFYNFVGNPTVPSTSRAYLTLGIPWDDDDDYTPDPEDVYIYQRNDDGTLTDVTDKFTYSDDAYAIEGWTIKTRVLGTYIISDTALDISTSYEWEDSTDDYEVQYKLNPVTGGGDYNYTPVTVPANYGTGGVTTIPKTGDKGSAAKNADGKDEKDKEDVEQLRNQKVPEIAPSITVPSAEKETQKKSIPWVPAVVVLLLAAAGGVGAYLIYRRRMLG